MTKAYDYSIRTIQSFLRMEIYISVVSSGYTQLIPSKTFLIYSREGDLLQKIKETRYETK